MRPYELGSPSGSAHFPGQRRHACACVLATALVGMLCTKVAAAETTIAGGNVINQTWTAAGSPYLVQGDVTVPLGAYLRIQAGAEVRFSETDGQGSGLWPSAVELEAMNQRKSIQVAAADSKTAQHSTLPGQ
jgi:hypothetical protein